jgi:hypothetical protein
MTQREKAQLEIAFAVVLTTVAEFTDEIPVLKTILVVIAFVLLAAAILPIVYRVGRDRVRAISQRRAAKLQSLLQIEPFVIPRPASNAPLTFDVVLYLRRIAHAGVYSADIVAEHNDALREPRRVRWLDTVDWQRSIDVRDSPALLLGTWFPTGDPRSQVPAARCFTVALAGPGERHLFVNGDSLVLHAAVRSSVLVQPQKRRITLTFSALANEPPTVSVKQVA